MTKTAPWPENSECFPPLKIPPYTFDAQGKILWVEPKPIEFKIEDVAGLGSFQYGAVNIISIEGEKNISDWELFFENHLSAASRKEFTGKEFAAFYVCPVKFKNALISEQVGRRLIRKEFIGKKNREDLIQKESEKFVDLLLAAIPRREIKVKENGLGNVYGMARPGMI